MVPMGLFSKDIQTMDDLLLHGLQDIYYAENQIVKSLAALNRPVVAGVCTPREQQDGIPFSMEMFDIFAQRSPQRALVKQDHLVRHSSFTDLTQPNPGATAARTTNALVIVAACATSMMR
jgi:hypothetical protein